MKCETIESLLVGYLRKELGRGDSELVTEHLASCRECREAYERLAVPWLAMDALPDQQPSPQVRQRFNALLAQENSPVRAHGAGLAGNSAGNLFRRLWPSRPIWAMAYSLLLLVGGITTGQLLPTLPVVMALNSDRVEIYSDFADIPEDSVVQWCAVQTGQYRDVL